MRVKVRGHGWGILVGVRGAVRFSGGRFEMKRKCS